jgi:hypothetical protein
VIQLGLVPLEALEATEQLFPERTLEIGLTLLNPIDLIKDVVPIGR